MTPAATDVIFPSEPKKKKKKKKKKKEEETRCKFVTTPLVKIE